MIPKTIISLFLVCALFLSACTNVSQFDSNSGRQNDPIAQPTETQINSNGYSEDEERFLELFNVCYEAYQREGLGFDIDYAELEDIYQDNPDNEMMRNLYYFCTACSYYWIAGIMDNDEKKVSGNNEAAKIDPNYDGPYATEVIAFAKALLGDTYGAEAERAKVEEINYENLTMQDKIDILNTITDSVGTGTNSDELWASIAAQYGISTDHVSQINIDIEVIKAAGEEKKQAQEKESAKIEHDAILSYGSGDVVIANTRDNLDDFLTCVAKEDTDAISQMILNGQIAYVENDTKVDIVEFKYTVFKVRILEGIYKGVECWTIMEAVQMVD